MTDSNTPKDPLLDFPKVEIESNDVLVYIIYKQGYFGHGIHGIQTDKEKAVQMADAAANRDRDNYHSYDVYPVPVGKLPLPIEDYRKDYGWMNLEPVYSVRKQGD